MDIIHRKCASHGKADTMSRWPADSAELNVESEEINSDAEICQAIHESICIDKTSHMVLSIIFLEDKHKIL
jgi:hypothetical protein